MSKSTITPTAQKLRSLLIQNGPLDWYKIIATLGDTKAVRDAAEALKEAGETGEIVEGNVVKLTLPPITENLKKPANMQNSLVFVSPDETLA